MSLLLLSIKAKVGMRWVETEGSEFLVTFRALLVVVVDSSALTLASVLVFHGIYILIAERC